MRCSLGQLKALSDDLGRTQPHFTIRKMKNGGSDPVYEKYVLKLLGIEKLER